MNFLGFDLEVSEVDLNNRDSIITNGTKIVEIGLVVWDADRKTPLEIESFIVKENEFKRIEPDMERCVNILTDDVLNYGTNLAVIHKLMKRAIRNYDVKGLVAHNGFRFDFPLLKRSFERHDLDTEFLDDLLKIDTIYDLEYPEFCVQKNLTYLAGYYGIRAGKHRAVFDALVMMEVFSHTPVETIIENANSPLVMAYANIKNTDENKTLVKNKKFYWNYEKRKYSKKIRLAVLEKEVEKYPFDVTYEEL